MMTPRASLLYTLAAADPWKQLNEDIDRGTPDDLYWTLRAFGLEGQVRLTWGEQELVWGGFLLDLACALAKWSEDPKQALRFSPVEQSNDVRVENIDQSIRFRSGVYDVSVQSAVAIDAVSGFLGLIAKDLGTHVDRIQSIPGFEWVKRRLPRQP